MAAEHETTPVEETTPAEEKTVDETPTVENVADEAAAEKAADEEPAAAEEAADEKPAAEEPAETAEVSKEDAVAEAQTLMATGKRHLLCGEIHNAIEALQTACQILSNKFGETADECGEAYFFYGKARLELARMEGGVLGNALTGVPEEGDTEEEDAAVSAEQESKTPIIEKYDASAVEETEREELAAQVYDAMSEKDQSEKQDSESMEKTDAEKTEDGTEEAMEDDEVEKEGETEKKEGETEKKEGETEKKEGETEKKEGETEKKEGETEKKEGETEKKEGETEKEEGETEKEEGDAEKEEGDAEKEDDEAEGEAAEGEESMEEDATAKEEEDEDVSNIQLAWETMDLARVIFSRHETKEMQLRAAQAHLKLGEVSVELENYEQAIKDFHECLNIQKKYLEADDRLIAETCYQLGVAHSYHRQYADSRRELQAALSVLEARKQHLEKVVAEAADDNKQEEAKKAAEEELKELADIMPDIEAKIKDTEEEEKEMKEIVKEEAKQMFEASAGGCSSSSGMSSGSGSSSDKPVNVLVPRKRKADEDAGDQTDKKPRAANGDHSNGDAVSNGASNGDHSIGDHSNGHAVSEKGDCEVEEVKVKTVEEVLEKKAEADAQMDVA